MSILTTCQCSRFVPAFGAYEQFQKSIIRPYPITLRGAQGILNRNSDGTYPTLVVAVQHTTLQR
jgi:hypothetical protein